MKTFLALVIGLLVGAGGMYWYMQKKLEERNCGMPFTDKWLSETTIDFATAKEYYCNYLCVTDSICREDQQNTRYLNISRERLRDILCKFETDFPQYSGIRIYPMVYPDDKQHPDSSKGNLLNVMILPLELRGKVWNNNSLFELIDTLPGGKNFAYTFSQIENQIGQCPPPRAGCGTDGATLYNATTEAMRVPTGTERQPVLTPTNRSRINP